MQNVSGNNEHEILINGEYNKIEFNNTGSFTLNSSNEITPDYFRDVVVKKFNLTAENSSIFLPHIEEYAFGIVNASSTTENTLNFGSDITAKKFLIKNEDGSVSEVGTGTGTDTGTGSVGGIQHEIIFNRNDNSSLIDSQNFPIQITIPNKYKAFNIYVRDTENTGRGVNNYLIHVDKIVLSSTPFNITTDTNNPTSPTSERDIGLDISILTSISLDSSNLELLEIRQSGSVGKDEIIFIVGIF